MNLIRIPPDTSLTHLQLTSLILRYRTSLRLRYPADTGMIYAPEMQIEAVIDLSKKTPISTKIRGDS